MSAASALFRRLVACRLTATPAPSMSRTMVTTGTGAFREEPVRSRSGLFMAIAVVVPGLLVGASISKNFASFLEENDLFVPSDDDED